MKLALEEILEDLHAAEREIQHYEKNDLRTKINDF
jgi:hypothetical protein